MKILCLYAIYYLFIHYNIVFGAISCICMYYALLLMPFMLENVHYGMKSDGMKPSGMMPWMEAMESWVVKLQLAPWECSDF